MMVRIQRRMPDRQMWHADGHTQTFRKPNARSCSEKSLASDRLLRIASFNNLPAKLGKRHKQRLTRKNCRLCRKY
jgi:hypothetical protein